MTRPSPMSIIPFPLPSVTRKLGLVVPPPAYGRLVVLGTPPGGPPATVATVSGRPSALESLVVMVAPAALNAWVAVGGLQFRGTRMVPPGPPPARSSRTVFTPAARAARWTRVMVVTFSCAGGGSTSTAPPLWWMLLTTPPTCALRRGLRKPLLSVRAEP